MMKINKDDFILIKSGTCLDPDGNIMIRSSDLDEYSTSELDNNLLAQIFKLSNGQNKYSEIIKKIVEESNKTNNKKVIKHLNFLIETGIAKNTKNAEEDFYSFSHNPPKLPTKYTTVEDALLLAAQNYRFYNDDSSDKTILLQHQEPGFRTTTRRFGAKPITKKVLTELLVKSYNTQTPGKRPTPSAGGIYPIGIYLYVLNVEGFNNGTYYYDDKSIELRQISDTINIKKITAALDNQDSETAGCWVILVANKQAHQNKYGARGIKYTLIESGIIAQSIVDTAKDLKLKSFVYGGFSEERILKTLNIKDKVAEPLLCVALGHEETSEAPKTISLQVKFNDLHLKLKDQMRIVFPNYKDSFYANLSDNIYFSQAWYKSKIYKNNIYCTGISTNTYEAGIKAYAECYERKSCEMPSFDYKGKYDESLGCVNPEKLFPLTQEQRNVEKLSSFDTKKEYKWKKGYDTKSNEILLPIDYIYYPLRASKNRLYNSSSNGVATHTDVEFAKQNAFLELIERDAFIRSWVNCIKLKQLPDETLPIDIKESKETALSLGCNLSFYVLPQNDVPTIMSIITTSKKPFFVMGCSSAVSYTAAAEKASTEAIVQLLSKSITKVAKQEISDGAKYPVSVDQHGMYYANFKKNANTLKKFFTTEKAEISPCINLNFENLYTKYECMFFEISGSEANNINPKLTTYRVVSPKLIPLTFGQIGVHHLHETLDQNIVIDNRPHYFT